MSLSKLLATPSPFVYKGETYLVPPWNYDIQAAFEKYFQGFAWTNLRKQINNFSDNEYAEEKSSLRRDIDSGKYDFGGPIVNSALDNIKHQKELIYLGFLYANKGKMIARELVTEIYENEEDKNELLRIVQEVNTPPNEKRLTNSTDLETPADNTKLD